MTSNTITTYDKYHDVYDQETIEFWEGFPKSTVNAFKNLLNGNKILDLGSGPGRDALLLREQSLKIICLDASEEMVKRTKALGFESIQSTFDSMEFDNNSFDGVWAYTSLLHISKIEMIETIKKIYKLLKPGGTFLIGMIEGEFEGEVERDSMPNIARYFKHYTRFELKDTIEPLGFKCETEEEYTPNSKTYLSQIYTKI